jgi:hypothetical protein
MKITPVANTYTHTHDHRITYHTSTHRWPTASNLLFIPYSLVITISYPTYPSRPPLCHVARAAEYKFGFQKKNKSSSSESDSAQFLKWNPCRRFLACADICLTAGGIMVPAWAPSAPPQNSTFPFVPSCQTYKTTSYISLFCSRVCALGDWQVPVKYSLAE